MPPAAPTKIRSARKMAVMATLQPTRGTAVTDFTTAAAARLWTTDARFDVVALKRDEPSPNMTSADGHPEGYRYNILDARNDLIQMEASPEVLDLMLENNFGTLTAGSFALRPQVSQYLTLALVESVDDADAQKVVLHSDAFARILTISGEFQEPMVIDADILAETEAITSNTAITLPVMTQSSPSPADVINIIAMRNCTFKRAGVSIRFSRVAVTLDQQAEAGHTMTGGVRIKRIGKTRAMVEFRGEVNAESFQLIENSIASTKESMIVEMNAPSPSTTYTFDFKNADFDVLPVGHSARGMIELDGVAVATVGTGGSFVTITKA